MQQQPQSTGQTHQPPQQQQMFAPTQTQTTGVVQQQQPTQTVGGTKPKRKISQAKPQTSPLRYIIRITHIERESEGCDIPGTLRPTFHLEMPDVMNPKSELWKLSFRCNLSDTTDDIKLVSLVGRDFRLLTPLLLLYAQNRIGVDAVFFSLGLDLDVCLLLSLIFCVV